MVVGVLNTRCCSDEVMTNKELFETIKEIKAFYTAHHQTTSR